MILTHRKEVREVGGLRIIRRTLYLVARIMGDILAVLTGRIFVRLLNRAIGRGIVSRLWR